LGILSDAKSVGGGGALYCEDVACRLFVCYLAAATKHLSDFHEIWHKISFPKIIQKKLNPLNAELNPICRLLVLLRARHILHVSTITTTGLQVAGLQECATCVTKYSYLHTLPTFSDRF